MVLYRTLLACPLVVVGLFLINVVVAGGSQHKARPLQSAQQASLAVVQAPAQWRNMSMNFPQFSERDLFLRQYTCSPGYTLCPDNAGCCLAATETCVPGGCCDTGEQQCGSGHCYNPSTSVCCSDGSHCPIGNDCMGNLKCCPVGEQLCGSIHCYNPQTEVCCPSGAVAGACTKPKTCCGNDYCYNPSTQKCCGNNGACLLAESCCTFECCLSGATCRSNGLCKANTCTEYSESTTTTYTTYTRTITKVVEVEEEDTMDFICPAMTVTNSASATLELGDDCSLTLYPPPLTSPASTTDSAAKLRARAKAAECLVTTTSINLFTAHRVYTTTTTVTSTTTPQEFSCIPLTVTNVVGDELSLDEECALDYSPGPSANSTGSSADSPGSSNTNNNSNVGLANSRPEFWSLWCAAILLTLMVSVCL